MRSILFPVIQLEDDPASSAIGASRGGSEQALRDSAERYRHLSELSSDIHWEQDEHYRFVRLWGRCPEWLESGHARLIGRRRWDTDYVNMTAADWAAHRALLEARQPFRDLELARINEKGDKVWVSVTGEPVLDADGVFKGYRGVARDITLSKRAEEELRESEARFRALTRLSADFYWETDEQHRIVQTQYGPEHKPVISNAQRHGKTRWDLPSTRPDAAGWAAHRAMVEAHLPFRDFELARIDERGAERHLSISGEPIFDAAGQFKGYRGVGREITERRRAEELLRLEHAVTRHLAEAATESAGLKAAIGALCQTQAWDCGRYLRADEAAGVLRFAEAWGVQSPGIEGFIAASRDLAIPSGVGFAGRVWQSGEPLWIADVNQDGRAMQKNLIREIGLHGAAFFPVTSEGRIIGVLAFNSREVREPDERLLQAVRVIGSQIGQFVQRKQAEARQAVQLRYQNKIAAFGQSAIGRREATDLIEDALQSVLEGLGAEAVAYLEAGPGDRELVLRAVAGIPKDPRSVIGAYRAESALARALARGEPARLEAAEGEIGPLPFDWARRMRGVALAPVLGELRSRALFCALTRKPGTLGPEEVNFLAAAASVLSAGLQRINSEARISFLAQFDTLTGLPNRALLADRFTQAIKQAKRHRSGLGVLFIDLDNFKLVNDTLGHAAGDLLLKEMARRLRLTLRSTSTVARISGDEFAVVLSDLARPDDAGQVAQKILERIAAPLEISGQEVFVTASIGIAAYPSDGADAEALLGAADAAMYRAKQSGRNAYQFFTPEINQRTRARAQLGLELRRALERGQFRLLYQPKYDLRTGEPCAAEALLRWQHPEHGMMVSTGFVPVLEETGLIVQVGEWVLARACEDIKGWIAAGVRPLPVAINLSARQFRQKDLGARIREVVAAAGVDPSLIELEITESQLMQDPDHAIEVMHSLRACGMRIAIDDFGTGYSSLAYLTRFPVAALKIDRSFVCDVLDDEADATIVRTIIDMAHTLGFTVIAEGVENTQQAAFLRQFGCEQAQGWLFGPPMPAAELGALIASQGKAGLMHA